MMTSLLAQELRRVNAPAELWDRVEMPRETVLRPRPAAIRWVAVAATLTVAALAWTLTASRQIQTSDAGEIRSFVQARTGLDLPLTQPPSVTKLSGARQAGLHTAEVAFTAGSVPALLRVEQAGKDVQNHARLVPGAITASWISAGQRYTIETSSPQALEIACRLCHG